MQALRWAITFKQIIKFDGGVLTDPGAGAPPKSSHPAHLEQFSRALRQVSMCEPERAFSAQASQVAKEFTIVYRQDRRPIEAGAAGENDWDQHGMARPLARSNHEQAPPGRKRVPDSQQMFFNDGQDARAPADVEC